MAIGPGGALAGIRVDSSEVAWAAKSFRNLPKEVRTKVVARAFGRVTKQIETRVVRYSAKRINLPQKLVRRAISSRYSSSEQEIVVRLAAKWVPLSELNPRQTRRGVSVRGRGSYKGAFITSVSRAGTTGTHGGHRGVIKREQGVPRFPIRQLYGPNPAHDLLRNGPDYVGEAIKDIESLIMPRVLHELNRLIGSLTRRR